LTRACRSRWKKHRTKFLYDGLGRLREQLHYTASVGGDVFHGGITPDVGGGGWTLSSGIEYIYDGNRVIQERDINNNPTVSYTRGNDLSGSLEGAGGIGGLLARSDTYSAGNFTDHNYYHADGNGNITYLETSAQGLAASYRYDAFGNTLSSSGTYATANTYRFSSKEWMSSVNGYYYLYRFYRPDLQRWPNRDPIEELGGLNLFAYTDNTPIDEVDPLGLDGTNDPSKNTEQVVKQATSDASCAKKACQEQASKPIGKRGPLPGSASAGAAGAVGGAVVEVGTGALQAGPPVYTIAYITQACNKCKDCRGDPATECDSQAARECDNACKICETRKGNMSGVVKKFGM
jgi:RHS repeat-associated protein